jgi:hypothetical protein
MAAPTLPDPSVPEAPEFPLLAVFAGLIVVAIVAIGVMLAAPSTLTLVAALATVMGFAAGVTWLLTRLMGEE